MPDRRLPAIELLRTFKTKFKNKVFGQPLAYMTPRHSQRFPAARQTYLYFRFPGCFYTTIVIFQPQSTLSDHRVYIIIMIIIVVIQISLSKNKNNGSHKQREGSENR